MCAAPLFVHYINLIFLFSLYSTLSLKKKAPPVDKKHIELQTVFKSTHAVNKVSTIPQPD